MVVGALGFALGMGMCAGFFEIFQNYLPTRGIILRWQGVVGAGVAVFVIVILASLLSIRRVLVLEPAIVFRG
jgi:putative ABC transport system permease protein